MTISLRGVARCYTNVTGSFSVQTVFGRGSLCSKLESLARKEDSFWVTECTFGWTAAFEQTWSHIVVRVKLNPDTGISNATMNILRNRWSNGIQTIWSNRWGVGRLGEATCPLTFEVQWVTANQHHSVRVRQAPPTGTNLGLWDTLDPGSTAAHEFGHMLGLVDEYSDTDTPCPARNPVNTGTIMDNNSNVVPDRMMTRFASNIGSNVVAI
jgi:hypothetical protein